MGVLDLVLQSPIYSHHRPFLAAALLAATTPPTVAIFLSPPLPYYIIPKSAMFPSNSKTHILSKNSTLLYYSTASIRFCVFHSRSYISPPIALSCLFRSLLPESQRAPLLLPSHSLFVGRSFLNPHLALSDFISPAPSYSPLSPLPVYLGQSFFPVSNVHLS